MIDFFWLDGWMADLWGFIKCLYWFILYLCAWVLQWIGQAWSSKLSSTEECPGLTVSQLSESKFEWY